MTTNKINRQFGVYCKGKLVRRVGTPLICSYEQAELLAASLDSGLTVQLLPGQYVAYDEVTEL